MSFTSKKVSLLVLLVLSACGQKPQSQHSVLIAPESLGTNTYVPKKMIRPLDYVAQNTPTSEAAEPLVKTYKSEDWDKAYGPLSEANFSDIIQGKYLNVILGNHVDPKSSGQAPMVNQYRGLLLNASTSLDLVSTKLAAQYSLPCEVKAQNLCVVIGAELQKKRLAKKLTQKQFLSEERAMYEVFKNSHQIDLNELMMDVVSYLIDHDIKTPDIPYARMIQLGSFMAALDPHTSLIDQKFIDVMKGSGNNSFTGIGIMLRNYKGKVFVTDVFEGGGAESSGLQVKDQILGVGDVFFKENLSNEEFNKMIGLMGGAENSQVKLTILRNGEKLELDVIRKKIQTNNVTYKENEDAHYLKYDMFTDESLKYFVESVEGAQKNDSTQPLILDLRGNGGGSVQVVINLSRYLTGLTKESFFYTFKRFIGDTTFEDFNSDDLIRRKTTQVKTPLIMLVDGASASASEVLASNLKHTNSALLLGKTTFGKGTAQGVIPVQGTKAYIKFTTGMYFTAKDYSPQFQGVQPHVEAELLANGEDVLGEYPREVDFPLALKSVEGRKKYSYTPSKPMQERVQCAQDQKKLLLETYNLHSEKSDYPNDFQMELALAVARECY